MNNLALKLVRQGKKNRELEGKIQAAKPKRQRLKKILAERIKEFTSSGTANDRKKELWGEVLTLFAALDKTSKFSRVKFRKRCRITGAPRGVKFGIRRNYFRDHAGFGQIAGVKKF